jgi:putative DNA primase/helicase
MKDAQDQFRLAMAERQIIPPADLIADGKIHRCDAEGKNGRGDAAYLLHLDGIPAGGLENHRDGRGWESWRAGMERTLSPAEEQRLRARISTQHTQREQADAARLLETKSRAQAIWEAASGVIGDHPYLTLKGVAAHKIRVFRDALTICRMDCAGALVIPMRDASGELCHLQMIAPNGEKRYLPGPKPAGLYFSIGTPSDVVCIAEGFATAASIHQATGHSVAAAFDSGGLRHVAKALREKLPAAKIVLCADDDYETKGNPGIAKATSAARLIGAYVAVPDFGANRPANLTDFNDLDHLHGPDAVKRCIDAAAVPLAAPADRTAVPIQAGYQMSNLQGPTTGTDSNARVNGRHARLSQDPQHVNGKLESPMSEPEPLRRPLPAAEPYPLQILGDVLGAAARRIRDVLCVPEAMAGQSILAAASLAVHAHADVDIDGRRELLSLWHMTIGVSGERKSACDQQALRAHRDFERAALESFARDKATHDVEMMAYEAATRSVTKGKDPDAIRHKITLLGAAPEAPLKPLLLVGNPTVEAIHKQLIVGLPSIGLFHDDAGEFLGGHSMSQDHRIKTAAGLSKLWDVGEFDRLRAEDGGSKYYGKRLALHLMLQPIIAESVLSDDVLTGQGFLARCLMSWPASTIGSRPYVEANLSADPELRRYWQRMRELLAMAPTMRLGNRNELEPRLLSLTSDAKRRWVAIHNVIEEDMADRGASASIRAWASKAPAQVLRIAGVLTLAERPDSNVIDSDQIDRAATLVNHHLAEAVRIVGTNSVPKEVRDAENLLAWCHQNHIPLLHSAAALQLGPSAIRTKQNFDKAINELERCGWMIPMSDGAIIDGKHRRRAWAVRCPS